MRFGKSWEEVQQEPVSTGGGNFISYPRAGTTRLRILDEPEAWEGWWEHYDPSLQKSYPCTNNRGTCPGCQSPNKRVQSASRRIGFNVVMPNSDGSEFYVNYFKVTRKVAERLASRAQRYGTIRDRDYSLTRLGTGTQTDYDVEAEDPQPVDLSEWDAKRKNPQEMLEAAFDDAFGEGASKALDEGKVFAPTPQQESWEGDSRPAPDFAAAASTPKPGPALGVAGATPPPAADKDSEIERLKAQLAAKEAELAANPPTEPEAKQEPEAEGADEGVKSNPEAEEDPGEPEFTLDDLKAMTKGAIVALVATEQKWGRLPTEHVSNKTKADLIQWIIDNS